MRRLIVHKRWVLPVIGTILFAVAVYFIALRYLFPYPRLTYWIETQFRQAGMQAKVEGIGPGPFAGVKTDSLVVTSLAAPDRKTELRNVTARLSLLSLLRFRPMVVVEAEAMGGTIELLCPLGAPRDVDASWRDIDLKRFPVAPDFAAVGLRGRSSGRLETRLEEASRTGLTGIFDAAVADARLGPGTMHGLPLPGVSLGNGQIRLTASNGKVQVEKVKFDGGNLDVTFHGTVEMRSNLPEHAVDGTLSLRPDGKASEDLGFLLAFFPGARASDGTYTAHVGGSLGSLVLSRPAPPR